MNNKSIHSRINFLVTNVMAGFVLLMIALPSNGQYVSRLGRFKVDEVKGCAPFTVNIIDTNLKTTGECTAGKPCLMNAGNNTAQQQNQFTITYTQPGIYKLSVLYQSIGSDDILITVDENIAPAFEVYTCSGLKTSIKITDKNYDQYFIDFNNDGVNENAIPNANSQVASFTYPVAGNYTIKVKGKDVNAADNCNAKLIPFTALPTLPVPQISTLTAVDNAQLKIDFTPQTNIQYKLEIAQNNATTFQQYQTLYGVNAANATGLKVDDGFYCFRLNSYDPCLNANTYSFPVCSQNLDLTIVSGTNELTIGTAALGITTTEVMRNNASYTVIPGAPTSFNDDDVICKTDYCYKVVSNYSGGTKSISLQKCGKAFTNVSPTGIDNVPSEVSSEGVALQWTQDPKFTTSQYAILKSENSNVFVSYNSSNTSTFSDTKYTTESNSCYKINYIDACNNTSQEGISICPMRLIGTLEKNNVITLRWSKLRGLKNGIKNYKVQKFDRSGGLVETYNTGTDTVYVDDKKDLINQVVQYRVIAEATEAGLKNSISNQIIVTKEANLFNPTAFSPDGVGPVENEKFTVYGQYIDDMELKIFDRWGALIFYTDKNEPWDGKQAGRAMPEGTYVWIANIKDFAGRTFTKEGTIVILKKK